MHTAATDFDAIYYLAKNPDVRQSGMDPLTHYHLYGCHEPRRYRNLAEEMEHGFDADWYTQRYPDVAGSGLTPLDHYNSIGREQGRFNHYIEPQLTAALTVHQHYLYNSILTVSPQPIAVHIHADTSQRLSRILEQCSVISCDFDLFCTYTEESAVAGLSHKLSKCHLSVRNLFIHACAAETDHYAALQHPFLNTLADYPCVCHVHTSHLSFPCEWLYSLKQLLSSREGILQILAHLEQNDTGVIFSEPYFRLSDAFCSPDYGAPYLLWHQLRHAFDLQQIAPGTLFCTGGMFWCRGDMLHAFRERVRSAHVTAWGLDSHFLARAFCYNAITRGKNNYIIPSTAARSQGASHLLDLQEKLYPNVFDAAWYVRTYPDVLACGSDPYTHFVRRGRVEGRHPCPCIQEAVLRAVHTPTHKRLSAAEVAYCHRHIDAAWDFLFAGILPSEYHEIVGRGQGLLDKPLKPAIKKISRISIVVLLRDMTYPTGLLSCFAQTAKNVEICVIDGSGGGAIELVRHSTQGFDGIVRVIPSSPDRVLTTACTQGVDLTTGDYLCFLDGQDRLDANFCIRMASLAQQCPADAVMCGALSDNGTDTPAAQSYLGATQFDPNTESLDFKEHIPFVFSGLKQKLFRRTPWQTANQNIAWHRDTHFAALPLLVRFARKASSVVRVENAWYYTASNRGGAAAGAPVRVYRDTLVAVQALLAVGDASRRGAYLHALGVHTLLPLLRGMVTQRPRYIRRCLERLAVLLDKQAAIFTKQERYDLRRCAGEIYAACLATAPVGHRLLFVDPIGIPHLRTDFLKYWKTHFPEVETDYFQCAPDVSVGEFLHRIALGHTSACVVTTGAWSTEYEFRTNRPLIQLWHGIGLGKHVPPLPAYMRPRLAFCSGAGCIEEYAKLYVASPDVVRPYGSIVTDRLLDADVLRVNAATLFQQHPDWKQKKIYLWCPTFRGIAPHIFQRDRPSLSELSRLLHDDEVLLIKYHPALRPYGAQPEAVDFPHTEDVSDDDVLRLLSVVDVFMTDYSTSICYAMLLHKKICCLQTDLDEQKARDGLLVDFSTWHIPIVTKAEPQTMLDCLRQTYNTEPSYNDYVTAYLSGCDGHSVPRIAQAIYEEYNATQRERGHMAAQIYEAQKRPLQFQNGSQVIYFKIDHAVYLHGLLLVYGWMTGDLHISLSEKGKIIPCTCHKVMRKDVAQALHQSEGEYGFSFAVKTAVTDVMLFLERKDWNLAAQVCVTVEREAKNIPWEALSAFSAQEDVHELRLALDSATVSLPPVRVKGFIDVVEAYGATEKGGVVYVVTGWMLNFPNLPVYYDNARQEKRPVTSLVRWKHLGVLEEFASAHLSADTSAGYILLFEDAPLDTLTLYVLSGGHFTPMAQKTVEYRGNDALPTLKNVVFPLPENDSDFLELCRSFAKELQTLVRLRAQSHSTIDGTCHNAPHLPSTCRYSIIIPVYGTSATVETQCLFFAQDTEILEQAEILYVIDDPSLYDTTVKCLEKMLQLFPRLPLRWIHGHVNRGFAGANNLAAAQARASIFCFCNADCLPRRAGWLGQLAAHLTQDATVGAVGCRLLHADGAIQHAGMAFSWRPSLELWLTDHPRSGCPPEMDVYDKPTEVPAVTGACVVLRAEDFTAVGGWSQDYLLGDFEDSDLCFRLRERGKRILYDPHVEMTHLERQSYGYQGDALFRRRVTLLNACVHQRRWQKVLEAST